MRSTREMSGDGAAAERFADQVLKARTLLGWNHRQLAIACRLSNRKIALVELADGRPPRARLLAIRCTLGIAGVMLAIERRRAAGRRLLDQGQRLSAGLWFMLTAVC